jgi:SAM-dependent methyltransferase
MAGDAEAGRPEPLGAAAIEINRTPRPWPAATGRPRCALVHAYGLGGVNADLVVEQAPMAAVTAPGNGAEIVCLSARTPLALRRTASTLAARLRAASEQGPGLADVALTLRRGRAVETTRWCGLIHDRAELLDSLDAVADGLDPMAGGGQDPILARLRAAGDSMTFGRIVRDIPPAPGARRVHLPASADEPLLFPLDGERPTAPPAAEIVRIERLAEPKPESSVVANFYDYVTRPRHLRFEETYLTLAPFPQVVPGFSWTSCMQDPARRPEHHALMLERQREMRRVAFAEVDFASVGRVLDIGCGLGTDLIVLAQAHPGLQGLGFTLSAEQAQAAGRRIATLGLANRLQVQQRDSSGEPFPGQFDLMIGFEVAHHVPDKEHLFANVRRALAPRGHLVLADTMAGTVAPVSLAEVGSYTLPRQDYADLFTRHGLAISSCIDLSQEIAHFLDDPAIDGMLASEERVAVATGRRDIFPGAAAVQRSWHAFGQALREGLMLYILVDAMPGHGDADLRDANRRQVGAA